MSASYGGSFKVALSLLSLLLMLNSCKCQEYAQVECLRDSDCEPCSICFERRCEENLEICWDNIDNDCDGETEEGCDAVCSGVECFTPPSRECVDDKILRTYLLPGVCILGTCRYDSRDYICESKCMKSSCVGTTNCGNGVCEDSETVKTCPADCRSSQWECGNGVCEPEENPTACPGDCLSETAGCGNETCDVGETPENCPGDCPVTQEPTCGNGVCEAGESVSACPNDCETVVFFEGKCEGESNAEECTLNEDADEEFHLDAEYLLGNAAAIVGDIDGDGYDDMAIGASRSNKAGVDSGAVYLLYGRREGYESMPTLGSADAIIVGEGRGDRFGYSLSAAGDVNNDGFADLLVGAHCASGIEYPAQGYVYLLPGGSERLSGEINIAGNYYFGQVKFMDSQIIGSAGWDVSGPGDIDGDGFDDILIGAPLWSQDTAKGAAYLVYGRENWESSPPQDTVWLDDIACGWVNDLDYTLLGIRVSGAGDLNSDGYSDILVGSTHDSSPEGWPLGRVYLMYGSGERFSGLSLISNADATLVHDNIGFTELGREVGPAGDMDADGYDDFVVGEPENIDDKTVVYLFYGSPEFLSGNIDVKDADAIFENPRFSHLGPNQGSVGDVNGDGFSDIAFGAEYQGKEAVFLFLGGSHRFTGSLDMGQANAVFFIDSDDECMGYTGSVVRGGGDINGDGFDDFLIGARGNCSGDGAQGYIYLVLGEGVL